MKCPECGSKDVIVLVHSLRLLCGRCMSQWSPSEDDVAALAADSAATSAAAIRASRRGRPETN